MGIDNDSAYEVDGIAVSVQNLTVWKGDRPILRDFSAEFPNLTRRGSGINQGQVIGVLGPNGVGKSTLFRAMAGMEDLGRYPNSGSICIGKDQRPVKKGMVGMVAQKYPLFRGSTVLGNLICAAKLGGMKSEGALDRSKLLLEDFGMAKWADLYPAQLSGGQQQRVAILQQVIRRINEEGFVLLLDEPFSSLDMIMKRAVIDLIRKITTLHEFNTVVVITHVIEEVASVADTLLFVGLDRDEGRRAVPGARVQEVIRLYERGLAWQPEIEGTPGFRDMVDYVTGQFLKLETGRDR